MGRPWLLVRMFKFRKYHRPKNPVSAIPKTQKLWKRKVLTHATHYAGVRCQLYLSVSAWRLADECGVTTATIYNLKKQKTICWSFTVTVLTKTQWKIGKWVHRAHNENFDRVLIERIRQRRGESMPLTGLFAHETSYNVCYLPKIRKKKLNSENVSARGLWTS
jgi:hypothetical protein